MFSVKCLWQLHFIDISICASRGNPRVAATVSQVLTLLSQVVDDTLVIWHTQGSTNKTGLSTG